MTRLVRSAALFLSLSPPTREYFRLLGEIGEVEFVSMLQQESEALEMGRGFTVHEDLNVEVQKAMRALERLDRLEQALEGKYLDYRLSPSLESINFVFDRTRRRPGAVQVGGQAGPTAGAGAGTDVRVRAAAPRGARDLSPDPRRRPAGALRAGRPTDRGAPHQSTARATATSPIPRRRVRNRRAAQLRHRLQGARRRRDDQRPARQPAEHPADSQRDSLRPRPALPASAPPPPRRSSRRQPRRARTGRLPRPARIRGVARRRSRLDEAPRPSRPTRADPGPRRRLS